MKYGIHWFRRDLRVAGNPALQKNFKENDGKVVGVFCFDKKFLARGDFSVNRFQLFINSLKALKKEMKDRGSDLLFLDIGPHESFPMLMDKLKDKPSLFSFNEDFEPFAIKRDKAISKMMKDYEVETHIGTDHVLIRPNELTKPDSDEGYKVYTPFSRRWLHLFIQPQVQDRIKRQKNGLKILKAKEPQKIFDLTWKKLMGKDVPEDHLEEYDKENQKLVTIDLPEAGSKAAYKKVLEFKKRIDNYGEDRDFPDIKGTSQLSPYLKNGTLTIAQIIAILELEPYKEKKSGRDIFFSELIWREFYYHVMARWPHVEKEEFNPKYKGLAWENDKKLFQAWKDGMTGYPIVDAGMRQLKETGWMHNRVRMIVASFLTKHLLIDWRWGEKYFMDQLLDGDLAPNNGGWQWAASTGTDAQPYFRIFNPWTQGKKFDKDAEYMKRFIPELKDEPAKHFHAPILGHKKYPEPIVDHATQRQKALELFQ